MTIAGPDAALDLDIVGGRAYVAFGTGGLRIYDLSDPDQPALLGGLASADRTTGVQVVGTTAFVADEDGGLRIVDVRNPAAPAVQGTLARAASDVQAGDGRAYISAWDGSTYQVSIVDVSNPAAPGVLSTFTTADASLLRLAGDYLITASVADVEFYDVRTPAAPRLAGRYVVPGWGIDDVAVAGDLVMVATGIDLRLLQVSGGDFAPIPVTDGPTLGSVSNGGRAAIRLSWVGVAGARFYEVEVSPAGPAPATTPQVYRSETTEITLLLDQGSYSLRVRGCNSLGCGPYSASSSATVTQSLQRLSLPLLQR